MGIYGFYIGKGIIVPVAYFEHKFHWEIKQEAKKRSEPFDDVFEDIFLAVVRQLSGQEDIDIVTLGHDAFQGRDGRFDLPALDSTPNQKALKVIERTFKRYGDSKRLGSYMFIGKCSEVGGTTHPELSHKVRCSELLYSLPAFLIDLARLTVNYTELNVDLTKISQHQRSCVWTFACDCCECCT